MHYDLIIKNGLVFDGVSHNGVAADVGIQDGRVVAVSASALDPAVAAAVLDAKGCWVMPGFLEMHSHYDAEILSSAALKESIRP